ncbi:hypothetical protein BC835DRAFT_1356594 [Cytidiella melzeri]|nr:hypothetical protein BC835DRAFT_1356594 [Cytidiella melzeri]
MKGSGTHSVKRSAALLCVELKESAPTKSKLNVERNKRQQQACGDSPEVLTSVSQVLSAASLGFENNACNTTQLEEDVEAAQVTKVEEVEKMDNAEVAETASTGSKRPRGWEALVLLRPAKKNKSVTQHGGSYDKPFWNFRGSTTPDAEPQLGSYALEMVGSTNGTRLHNSGVIFPDELISLWCLDASSIVRTCLDVGSNREKLSLKRYKRQQQAYSASTEVSILIS